MKKVNGVWQAPCAEEYRKAAREWLLFQKRTVPDDKMIDIILRLINLDQEALKNLEGLEAEWVCDEMGGCEWCSEHCKWDENAGAGARKECWEHYLLYGKDGE